jgi:Rrf2 family transcriptional regulator, cysteine metabolism repressor
MGTFVSDRMRATLKADYALRAILDLTLQPFGQPVRIADIAKRQKIPQKFLELILASLKQGDLVESRRGVQGGYMLARPADTITVGQVLRYVEGTGHRRQGQEGPFDGLWRSVDEAVASVVDHSTLAELGRSWCERRQKYVPNWEI